MEGEEEQLDYSEVLSSITRQTKYNKYSSPVILPEALEHLETCRKQERELKLRAADSSLKTYHYKKMKYFALEDQVS